MDSHATQDGQIFVRSLAQFIRQHEKALANSLQLTVNKRQSPQHLPSKTGTPNPSPTSTVVNSNATSTSSLASALSFAGIRFMSPNIKSAHLTLTPHHLFYLLSRLEEHSISVGMMNVRIESIHSELSQSNYVSFLQGSNVLKRGRSDADSIHSVSSVRSVMSGMSSFWSNISLGSSQSKSEKAKAATEADLKYLYSAFTKLPSLRLTSDPRARLIQGYEEFPFDTAVPLFVFKNIQQLDVVDMDFRQLHGWDRLADQLCLLTVKRGNLDDPTDLLTNIVLDDAERRRRRSTRIVADAPSTPSWNMPSTPATPRADYAQSQSEPSSPTDASLGNSPRLRESSVEDQIQLPGKHKALTQPANGSASPKRPTAARPASSYRHSRTYSSKIKRSGSGSSNSSEYSSMPYRTNSSNNMAESDVLPASKWQRLKYLSLADNDLTNISASSLAPVASTLRSLNLSSNLFTEIPDSLATLSRLTSLDLSNCMIDSLQSLSRCPLPAITTVKLKSNRLQSLAGVERLLSLENLHVQENLLTDPEEAARLTGIPNLRRIWVKHNPMTKKNGYRVKIMNLFRQTPGYLEDILIDDQVPTYAERKLLVQRAPEIERIPSAIVSPICDNPIVVQNTHTVTEAVQVEPDRWAMTAKPEIRKSSARRRKGPRRRIVDLAANHTTPVDSDASDLESLTIRAKNDDGKKKHADDVVKLEAQATFLDAGDSDVDVPAATEPAPTENDQRGDNYRLRIEALRRQFGNNWLNALSEQQWHADHHYANETERTHAGVHLVSNPLVVSAGRSLG